MRLPDLRHILPVAAIALSGCGALAEPIPTPDSPYLPPPTPQTDARGGKVWRFSGHIGPEQPVTVVCSGSTTANGNEFDTCAVENTHLSVNRNELCDQLGAGLLNTGTIFIFDRSRGGVRLFLSDYDIGIALSPYLQCHSTRAEHRPKTPIYQGRARSRISRRIAKMSEQSALTASKYLVIFES